MKAKILALPLAAALLASPALADLQNGEFTTPIDAGYLIGQQNWAVGANFYGAQSWSNTLYEPGVIGFNFVMADAHAGSPGVFGTVKLWTSSDVGTNVNNTWNGLAANGGNFLALDGAERTSAVEQTVTGLTVGNSYSLSFNYAFAQQLNFDGATTQSLKVFVEDSYSTTDTATWQSSTINLAQHDFSGWNSKTINFTADATSEVVAFLAVGDPAIPPFALVSNVSLPVSGGVPEIGTWAMMMAGFGAIGFAAFRSRRSARVA